MFQTFFLFSLLFTSTLHLILILCDVNNGILSNLMRFDFFFFIFIILTLLSLILFLLKILNQFGTIILSLIGTIGLFNLFYFSKGKDLDYHINPVGLIINYMCVSALLFLLPIFCRQTKLIMLGLTVKQYESILNYKKTLIRSTSLQGDLLSMNTDKTECYLKKIEEITIKQKVKNLLNFCRKPIPQSLLGYR